MNKFIHKTAFIKGLLVGIFLVLSFSSALRESLTYDEIVDIQAGRDALLSHSFSRETNNPPFLRELQVAPLLLTQNALAAYPPNIQILPARITTLVLGVILLLIVIHVTGQYFGTTAGIFAGALYIFEPNILANSHYATHDVGITLFIFLTYILLLQKQTIRNVVLLSVSIGLGLSSKMTFISFIFPSVIFLGFLNFKNKLLSVLWNRKISILSIGILSLFILWSTYFFKTNVVVQERQDAARVSARLMKYAVTHNNILLRDAILFFKNQQLPLGDYLGTVKNILLRSSYGSTCFFLGSYISCEWYFMPVNLLLKIPLPLFVFFALSSWTFFADKKRKKEFLIFLIPIVSILGVSMVLRMSPLVRYVLPLFPFFLILCASGFSFWTKSKARIVVFLFLLLWYIVGTMSSFPHFISYANELTFGRKVFLLTDSNMDWGQAMTDIASYHVAHPNTTILLSYFGRDNGDEYGLKSNIPYGSYKGNEICLFHVIKSPTEKAHTTMISVSNWYGCGYNKLPVYNESKIKAVVGQSIFVF